MKYLSQLDNNKILELIRIYMGDEVVLVKTSIERSNPFYYARIDSIDKEEGYLEDGFELTDYTCDPIDYMDHEKWKQDLRYKKKMYEWFGDQYVFDFIFGYGEMKVGKDASDYIKSAGFFIFKNMKNPYPVTI